MIHPFYSLKLFFTDRTHYNNRKQYLKVQRNYRKQLIKLSKKFCPWSGYYMHEMIMTMVNFYSDVYKNKLNTWSLDERTDDIANQLHAVQCMAKSLEHIDDADDKELIADANSLPEFRTYIEEWETKWSRKVTDKLLSGLAYDFLEKYYTSKIYQYIGQNIWNWSD